MLDKHFHLVVRFSDTMFDVGDVVAIHNEIVKEHGKGFQHIDIWSLVVGGIHESSRLYRHLTE